MNDLNEYGSASRCLLRLRENQGEPVMSDPDFLKRYRARFPHWESRPGQLNVADLTVLASELKLADAITQTADYDTLVAAFTAGEDILVMTPTAPLQRAPGALPHATTSIVVTMDAQGLSLWWPEPGGREGILPRADRTWWQTWGAEGIILHTPRTPTAGTPSVAALAKETS